MIDIEITVRSGLAKRWVALMARIAPLVGYSRAYDWAIRGGCRLLRVEVAGHRVRVAPESVRPHMGVN